VLDGVIGLLILWSSEYCDFDLLEFVSACVPREPIHDRHDKSKRKFSLAVIGMSNGIRSSNIRKFLRDREIAREDEGKQAKLEE
jgi:hypothetical protein